MSSPLILAIDQGTSSTKCLLVDERGGVAARGHAEIGQSTPRAGWVEQDPGAVLDSVRRAVAATVTAANAGRVIAIGLSTQRESCVIWDRRSGEPLTPVLSWQDLRTQALCADLRARGFGAIVRQKSGLPLDPMFSAAKAKWLLDQIDRDRVRARAGDLCIGTIDSFLLARLGGEHMVEAGNASRTQLVDVVAARFDDELLSIFDVPLAALPRIVPSVGPFPTTRGLAPLPDGVPVRAVMADSHSALFAHGAFAPGPIKATHGTGASVMGLLDRQRSRDGDALHPGLCLTLAWQIDAPVLAFEGNIRSAGATLIWAAALFGIDVNELSSLAATSADAEGVHPRAGLQRPSGRLGGTARPSPLCRAFRSAPTVRKWRAPRSIRSPIRSPTSSMRCAQAALLWTGCMSTEGRRATINSCSSKPTSSACRLFAPMRPNCRRSASRIWQVLLLASSRSMRLRSLIAAALLSIQRSPRTCVSRSDWPGVAH